MTPAKWTPPYDPASKCPKCGGGDASSAYQHDSQGGFIVRRCLRCGFVWNELPLDAERGP